MTSCTFHVHSEITIDSILIYIIILSKITFDFGRQKGMLLSANISPSDLAMISSIVIIVSILASLQPAVKASRMDPIKALGHI